jgi:hypothetical protein
LADFFLYVENVIHFQKKQDSGHSAPIEHPPSRKRLEPGYSVGGKVNPFDSVPEVRLCAVFRPSQPVTPFAPFFPLKSMILAETPPSGSFGEDRRREKHVISAGSKPAPLMGTPGFGKEVKDAR